MLFMIKLNLYYKNYFTIFPFLPKEITSDTKKDLHAQKQVTFKGLEESDSERECVSAEG